ncbi:MAG: hypothetical protein IKP40_11680 [Clostridia bacterium]|nr:hypothetical protein [Clostridia bacterium]
MKRLMALILALMTLVSFTAALADAPLAGGWTPAESAEVTEELRAVFDKGMEGLMGVSYTPVAYLGSQIVAGTNHCFLCQATVVYPGAAPDWKLVYLYEDFSGSVTILTIADFDFGALCDYGAGMAGE